MITQIQFKAPLPIGAWAVAEVFGSLPSVECGEEGAWASPEAAQAYCDAYPEDRTDVGGYYVPYVKKDEEDVTTIVTPASGRPVSYWPEGQLWTVDFTPPSTQAADELLTILADQGIAPQNVAHWGS